MSYWYLWIIIGIILLILEILTPGFVLGIFGIACFVSAILAGLEQSVNVQLLGFAVSSAVIAFTVRPLVVKYCYSKEPKIKTNVDALIGMTGIVIQPIDPTANTGRVKLGGEDWRAVAADDQIIETGCKVKVEQIDGCKVVVTPINADVQRKES